jgi:DNA-binding Xre family transcriptional regulator
VITNQTDEQTPMARLMVKQGISNRELAQDLQVSETQVSRWRTNRVKPIRLYRERLARALKANEEELWPKK